MNPARKRFRQVSTGDGYLSHGDTKWILGLKKNQGNRKLKATQIPDLG